MEKWQKWRVYALGVFGVLLLVNWAAWGYVTAGSGLRVTFFDIGQGDSIFVETPQGHQILIDGGPNSAVIEKLGKAMPFWDKTINLMVLTHPEADHISGLVDVLKQYAVQNVLWTGVEKDTNIFAVWERALLAEDTRVILARAPQKLVWSQNSANAFLEILYPDDSAIASVRAVNNTSIISRLVFGGRSFLFTGDIEKTIEQKLVEEKNNLHADVLKVPHHGSKTSSSESFLAALSPRIAVIQVGAKNRYGHPAEEVMERFAAFGIPVLRSDLNGDILITSDGTSLRIQ